MDPAADPAPGTEGLNTQSQKERDRAGSLGASPSQKHVSHTGGPDPVLGKMSKGSAPRGCPQHHQGLFQSRGGGRLPWVVQWLRLHAPTAGAPGLISGQGTRAHVLKLMIPHAAMKTWRAKKTKSWGQIFIFRKSQMSRKHLARGEGGHLPQAS